MAGSTGLKFTNRIQASYYTRILRQFTRYIHETNRILDVGCGDGLWTRLLSGACGYAVGVDVVLYSKWKEPLMEKVDFIQADAGFLPFRNNSFDVVFEKDSLHHVNQVSSVMVEMRRVCKRTIVILESNRYNPASYVWMVKIRRHNHFSYDSLRELVRQTLQGMRVKFCQIEAHYMPLPVSASIIDAAMQMFEQIAERTLRKIKLCNYNLIVATDVEESTRS